MTSPNIPAKVLLVDDLEENLVALEALLRGDGVTCLKARSGEEALELLLANDVALALLDIQMPGMDGFELAEFMRGIERACHVPIIFLTAGSADLQRRFRGYEAGAVDFIHKPVESDILRSKARIFLDLYDQRRQIAAQRDELTELTEALQATDRRKNEFLAILAHELRNPLMALGAGLQLLERREGTEAGRQIRGQMHRHVQHVSRLIEDLLDTARIDQGKISLKKERFELQDVLAFALEASEPTILAADHRLTVHVGAVPILLEADYARVAQIVSNLLSNAAKYTPRGGEIQLSARSNGDFAIIEVADSGVGIDKDMQERIFDMFAQIQRTDGEISQGLGIGLSLVRQLVELHDGTIALKSSTPGQGSVFEVQLPKLP